MLALALFSRNFTGTTSTGMKYTSFVTISTVFLLLTGATLFLVYLTDRYILTFNFYAISAGDSSVFGDVGVSVYKKVERFVYLFSAGYLLLKILAIAAILRTALYLNNASLPFGKVFLTVTAAEYIFLIPAVIKIYWFHHYYPQGNLSVWHRFYPLSAMSFLSDVPADWIYPLQTLNVFEVIYWFLLAFGLSRTSGLTFDRSIRLVVTSYLPVLFIWVTVAVFSSLLLFPQTG